MGLPLFRAPVDSDIKTKTPKDPPTRARSTIRRDRRTTSALNGTDTSSLVPSTSARFYARRRNRVVSPSGFGEPNFTIVDGTENAPAPARTAARRSAPSSHEPYPVSQILGTQNDSARPSRSTHQALREVASRNGMSQEMARYFGEHMARLHAATSSRTEQNTDDANERDETDAFTGAADLESRSWFIPSDRPAPPRHTPRFTATPEARASRQPDANTRAHDTGSQLPPRFADVVLRREDGHLIAMRRLRAVRVERAPGPRDASTTQQEDASPVDGLGDRNRSLSPEDDGVWDTLLSSITPDPQPPSVGTSFASTSGPASAATSQSTGTSASARTHLTTPATMDELEGAGRRGGDFEFEQEDHPCESGGETEGDDDDDNEEQETRRLRRFARARSHADAVAQLTAGDVDDDDDDDDLGVLGRARSYADVVRRMEDEDLEGSVDDMQRIVRNLARREDIPDEWWAEAGLSRSLQHEA